jgi:hypothetical protein
MTSPSRETDLHQLFFRELNQIRIRRIPESVVLETEILEAIPALSGSGTISGDQERKFWIRPTCTLGS